MSNSLAAQVVDAQENHILKGGELRVLRHSGSLNTSAARLGVSRRMYLEMRDRYERGCVELVQRILNLKAVPELRVVEMCTDDDGHIILKIAVPEGVME